ncbi:MAG TPA: O-antigen ligase family protein [Pyrinomonadaceae bacterium]|nr:O-antigen ligase family protein [Pyrinomonadaceae bacterium]
MKTRLRKLLEEPLLLLAALWPFALLAPHLPGLPRPTAGGLPWRQEFLTSLLLTLTLALLFARPRRRGDSAAAGRVALSLPLPLLLAVPFVAFVWASALWAGQPWAAAHMAFQWSAYLIFFALMSRAATRPRILRASFVSLGAVVWVLGLACAFESLAGGALTDGNLRSDLKPLLRGSGGFGEIMAVATFLFAAGALTLRRKTAALACGATAALAWLATIQAMQRAPFVGGLLGLGLLMTVVLWKRSCRPRGWARPLALSAALALVVAAQALPTSGADGGEVKFAGEAAPSTIEKLQVGVAGDESARARLLFWGAGVEMFRARPFTGVGANNYEPAFPEARARFAARYPSSPLVRMNEGLLVGYAHNEYVQMLAELGGAGLLLFALFAASLAFAFLRSLKNSRRACLALCAASGALAFAASSGASASSFRNMGGGLVFFFAAALVASSPARRESVQGAAARPSFSFARVRPAVAACALALMLLMTYDSATRAAAVVLHGAAQSNAGAPRAEELYRASLRWDSSSAAAHFSYGAWLQSSGRAAEAVPHLRRAVAGGFNSSICYARLAFAEEAAGDAAAAERTLSEGLRAYPLSVFLRVSRAVALERLGRREEADVEMVTSLLINSLYARGWRALIEQDVDAASAAARADRGVMSPGKLEPAEAVYLVIEENERRFPERALTGWRARHRSFKMP